MQYFIPKKKERSEEHHQHSAEEVDESYHESKLLYIINIYRIMYSYYNNDDVIFTVDNMLKRKMKK